MEDNNFKLPKEKTSLTESGKGLFNLFKLEPYEEGKSPSIPYKRRDFFKIMLVKGKSKVHYADKIVHIEKQALSFSNPNIPYQWEHLDAVREGEYCIFNNEFFEEYKEFCHYEVFQAEGDHIFELTDREAQEIKAIYKKMEREFNSEYKYKYDVIRNHILEILHFALKSKSPSSIEKNGSNASKRITTLFLELLERQFPIEDHHPKISLRSASDFADSLNVHVNHLNRAIKETTGKTTTHLITDRILQESKVLLKYADWDISQIAYALSFKEATHFSNFFKKHMQVTPLNFRKSFKV